MSEQPYALRLAEILEAFRMWPDDERDVKAAAELRRLHAENSALAAGQCTEGGPWGDDGGTPYCKLKEVNQELVEALEDLMEAWELEEDLEGLAYINARAAIAKARGEE